MSKTGITEKELFTVLGEFKLVDNKKRFIPKSPAYYNQESQKVPLGKVVAVEFKAKLPSRSQAQLRYHWVLIGYLAEHCGYTGEEMHDAVMRAKFGIKTVKVGKLVQQVRKSISGHAYLSKADTMELINYDLELCAEMDIHVPTMEELGYLPS